jgi:hypothetical protein
VNPAGEGGLAQPLQLIFWGMNAMDSAEAIGYWIVCSKAESNKIQREHHWV